MFTIARSATRRVLVAAGATGVIATALVGCSGTASAAEVAVPVTPASVSGPLVAGHDLQPSWCPLGKAHKGGKGCWGGGLDDQVKKVVKPAKRCAQGAWKGAKGGAEFGGNFGTAGAVAGTSWGAQGGCWWGVAH